MNECRRCADCEDQSHHWMEDESEITEGEMVYACKHCNFEASAEESTFLETIDGTDYFLFVCEGCGEAGDLGIAHAEGMRQFNCPSQCGASYIRWNDPIDAHSQAGTSAQQPRVIDLRQFKAQRKAQ